MTFALKNYTIVIMTVKELISKLESFDPNMLVVVDGYEGGYDDPQEPHRIPVILNFHTESYYGKHGSPFFFRDKNADCEAVLIPRYS